MVGGWGRGGGEMEQQNKKNKLICVAPSTVSGFLVVSVEAIQLSCCGSLARQLKNVTQTTTQS